MWLYHRSPSPSSHPKLTPHSEVDFQLADGEGVLAAAEVDAFVILADVEYGQLEDRAFLRQDILGTRYNVLLLETFSPGGVCRRYGDGLTADQSDAGVLLSRDQRLTFGIRRLWEGRTNTQWLSDSSFFKKYDLSKSTSSWATQDFYM